MACSSCGGGASANKYPYEAVMPDGARVMVSSAAQERVERERAYARMRGATGSGNGYTVRSA